MGDCENSNHCSLNLTITIRSTLINEYILLSECKRLPISSQVSTLITQSFLSLQRVDYQASVLDLDQNHTHFILVDSGASGDNNAEIKHRATLVKHISNLKIDADEPTSINVPVITVILDEGAVTIKHLKTAIDASIPAVIFRVS